MGDGSFCLIVSDTFDVQDLYVLTLRTQRIRAVSVGGHDDAILVIRCMPVAAVLYDVERLPGWESLAAFRREIQSSIPIVVVSSGLTAGRSYRLLARQLGCAAFIARPCSPFYRGAGDAARRQRR